jgi:hypothetical protein
MPRFDADESPDQEGWEELAAHAPGNPFYTRAYAEARMALGWRPWIVAVRSEGGLVSGCPAFVRSGYLSTLIELPSMPSCPPAGFWDGLIAWCRRQRASRLEVNSFGSEGAGIPALTTEQTRRIRCEYRWDLGEDGRSGLSTNHRRNIKRGGQANLALRQVADVGGCERHADLMASSMDRRRGRGEEIATARQVQFDEASALVRHGAGRLFQATDAGGAALSSILVLLAGEGAYYHSAGTSPEGMKIGASHWLVYEIAGVLRASGARGFILGGVSERGSGREQFKSGFGARRVDLEAVTVVTEGGMRRWLGTGARLLRDAARTGLVR